jgi:hypothetical protein
LTYGLSNFCTGVLLVGMLQDIRRFRWLLALYVLVLLLSYDVSGHRSGVATALLRIAIVWHVVRKPFRNHTIAAGVIGGLTLFNILGYLRGVQEGANTQLTIGVGEFLGVWGNAIELNQIGQTQLIDVPALIRFGEFFSFIPSQLLGDAKSSLDNWFAETYHNAYFLMGGGLAFGAISQAIVGGGIVEAAIRGLALGSLAGGITRWLQGEHPRSCCLHLLRSSVNDLRIRGRAGHNCNSKHYSSHARSKYFQITQHFDNSGQKSCKKR